MVFIKIYVTTHALAGLGGSIRSLVKFVNRGIALVFRASRPTPLAPDKGDHPARFSFFSPDVFPPIGDDITPALCG